MGNTAFAQPRPEGALRLDEFCGPTIHAWIDGRAVELSRIEIHFASNAEKVSTVERLAYKLLKTREDALDFFLNVLEHFSKEVPVKSVPVVAVDPVTSVTKAGVEI